jgi:hypothetical protein
MSFLHLPTRVERELQTKVNGNAVSERRNMKLLNIMSVGVEKRCLN